MPANPIRSVVTALFNRSRMNLAEATLLLMVSSMAEIEGGTLRRRNLSGVHAKFVDHGKPDEETNIIRIFQEVDHE